MMMIDDLIKIRERGIRCLQALKKNVLTRDH